MDRQGNTYTILYSIVLVVVVAALLAVVSLSLQPRQNENRQNEKRQNILSAIHVTSSADSSAADFEQYIKGQYIMNAEGTLTEGDAFGVDVAGEYGKPASERQLPVFVAEVEGARKYILPVYGAGLWGPIWGYIALDDDKDTVYGAFFDHSGETPGLGAEIATPHFTDQFQGKKIFENSELVGLGVMKGGANGVHEVDGISGGTLTSKGVESMIKSYLSYYEPFLKQR